MSAVAELWPQEPLETPGAPGLCPVDDVEPAPHGNDPSDARWNVLVEELVSFPTRAQRIFLDRAPEPSARSRAYADAWLDGELERLRGRRERALSLSPAAARPPAAASPRTLPRDGQKAQPQPSRAAREQRSDDVLPRHRPATKTRGLRRLLPGAASLAVLVGCWFGAGALASSAHPLRVVQLPGSVPVKGGYAYVVRPGDTLWSIASRIEPGSNPQPLVDRLEAEIGGRTLEPGDRLVLPG